MTWFIMVAGIPEGSQMVAVGAPSKSDAIQYARDEVKKKHNLPNSYTIMPRVLYEVDTELEAQEYMDMIHLLMEEEANNGQS